MTRLNDTYKGFRYLVDTLDAGGGRYGYQTVVDGKRPIVGAPCTSEAEAAAAGIRAAHAKIDEVLEHYKPRS